MTPTAQAELGAQTTLVAYKNPEAAVEAIAGAVNAAPDIISSVLPPAPDSPDEDSQTPAHSALQTEFGARISGLLVTTLTAARVGNFDAEEARDKLAELEQSGRFNPITLKALGAVAYLAIYVQADSLRVIRSANPEALVATERASRYDQVSELLAGLNSNSNSPEASLRLDEKAKEPVEYASKQWFQDFLEAHPELHELDGLGRLLEVYALVGSGNYDAAMRAIDQIEGLSDDDKFWAKRYVVVNRLSANADRPLDAIDQIKGLSDGDKAGAKRYVVVNRLSANTDLPLDAIDQIKGLSDVYKVLAKREVVVNRLSANTDLPLDAIDQIKGLSDGNKAWAKRYVVVNRLSANTDLPLDAIDQIEGLSDVYKVWATQDIVVSRLRAIKNNTEMAKALINFARRRAALLA